MKNSENNRIAVTEKESAVNKMNKSQFLSYVAKKNDINSEILSQAYTAIVDGIADLTGNGRRLSLAGFGVFSAEIHKGHPVQFNPSAPHVDDYVVLKFSASDVLNRRIRKCYGEKEHNSE